MSEVFLRDGFAGTRVGGRKVWAREDLAAAEVLARLGEEGEVLKRSPKALVRRVGDWVVKERSGLLKHTFQKGKCRAPWAAAMRLHERGVGVPEPLAYVERGRLGLHGGHAMVSAYLEGCRDVEHFLVALVQRGAGQDTLEGFLEGIADAVNKLNGAGAYHADLSGKNIFTKDGVSFSFIDLDSVELDGAYDDERRMLNHVQLYDSFCDHLNDSMLVPFILRMLTDAQDPRVWMPRVRKAQSARRMKTLARWEKQGVPPRVAGMD